MGDHRAGVVEEGLETGLSGLGEGPHDVGVRRRVVVGREKRGGVGPEAEAGGGEHHRVGAGQPGEVRAGGGERLHGPSLVLAPGDQRSVEGDLLDLQVVLPLENLPEDLAGEHLHLGQVVEAGGSRRGVNHEADRRLLVGGEERHQVGAPSRGEHDVLGDGHAEGDVAGDHVVGGADAGTAGTDLDVEVALLEEAEEVGGVERGVVGRGEPVGLYRHRGHLRQHRHGSGDGHRLDDHLGLLGGGLGLGGSRLGGRSGLFRGGELCFEFGHLLVGDSRVGVGRLQSGRSLSGRGRRRVGLGAGGVGLGAGGVGLGLSGLDRLCVYSRGGGGGSVLGVVAAGGCDEHEPRDRRDRREDGAQVLAEETGGHGNSSVGTDCGEGGRLRVSRRNGCNENTGERQPAGFPPLFAAA